MRIVHAAFVIDGERRHNVPFPGAPPVPDLPARA